LESWIGSTLTVAVALPVLLLASVTVNMNVSVVSAATCGAVKLDTALLRRISGTFCDDGCVQVHAKIGVVPSSLSVPDNTTCAPARTVAATLPLASVVNAWPAKAG
jgi:hypothetical protein